MTTVSPLLLIPIGGFILGFLYYAYVLHPSMPKYRVRLIPFGVRQFYSKLLEGQMLYVLGERLLNKLLPAIMFIEQMSDRYLKLFAFGLTFGTMKLFQQVERIIFGRWLGAGATRVAYFGRYIYLLRKHAFATHIEQGLIILLLLIIGALVVL